MTIHALPTIEVGRNQARTTTHDRAVDGPWRWPLPAGSVLATFDDAHLAGDALGALAAGGGSAAEITMVSGEVGARRLRESFARRDPVSRLVSFLEDEGDLVERLEAISARGGAVLLVRPAAGRADEVAAALGGQGARVVRRSGRWTYTDGRVRLAATG